MSSETSPPQTRNTLYGRPLNEFETRLALIHHGSWQDPIHCSFEYESFQPEDKAHHHYSALSYVWGTSKAKETIQIDGYDHKISVNLACAIRHLRDKRHLVLIWIDAICINQEDNAERGSQVAMMRDIYAHAQRVIVFLGDGSYFRIPQDYVKRPPPAPITFSSFTEDAPLIDHFHHSWEKLCRRPEWYSFCTICVIRLLEDVDGYRDVIKCIANGKATSKLRLFELIRQFMNSQWWQRVWVVQESTVSSEVVVQYGNVKIPWTILATSAKTCEKLGWGRRDLGSEHFLGIEREYAKVLPAFTRHVFEIERLRREWEEQQGSGLLLVLQEFSGRKATDDRDKVFALLGLASDIKTIEPNYSLSTFQVYRHTVLDLIKHSGSLTALSGDMKRKNSGGIPTWIPDWSAAIEEPDRRRMQVDATRKLTPRWRIHLMEHEHEYWEFVASNARKLHEEIELGKRMPLPNDIVKGLIRYEAVLKTVNYRNELMRHQSISLSEEGAIRSCKEMYKGYLKDPSRFGSTIPIRKFIDAHLSLPRTWNERYKREIVLFSVKIYWLRLLDLLLRNLHAKMGNINRSHSLLSDKEKEDIVEGCCLYPSACYVLTYNWEWDRYMRIVYPIMVKRMTERVLLKTQLAEPGADEVMRLTSLVLEVTDTICMEYILRDPMTFDDPEGASIDAKQASRFSELIWSALHVLQHWSRSIRPATLHAIDQIKHACQDLISWHIDKRTDLEYDDTTLFSTGVVLLGSAAWTRALNDSGPLHFNFSDETSEKPNEDENTLHISSKCVAKVGDCSERLITWVDSASRISTTSQWAVCALKSKTHDFALRFVTSLVGGLYEESPGSFRQLRRPEENGLLWNWFESSVLPRLCAVNTAVSNQQLTWLMDGRAEDHVELDTNKSFDAEMRLATEGRVFFTTEDHGMGLGPGSMMPGDEVHVLPGGNRPFVLRPRAKTRGSSTDEYELIGDCFYLMDDGESQESEPDLLQGCLPVELLGRFLDRDVGSKSIILC